jgi:hypothetical protein
MAKAVRLRSRDLVGSLIGFLIVLGALVAIDPRVTFHVRAFVTGNGTDQVTAFGDRAAALGEALVLAVRYQSIEHAPMLVFTAVAIVLTFVMVRA